jgi:hypothetical protein
MPVNTAASSFLADSFVLRIPGMTPATCIFHQAAINNYKPYEFIDKILDFGEKRMGLK